MANACAASFEPGGGHPLADVDERVPVRLFAAAPDTDAGGLIRRLLETTRRPFGCIIADVAAIAGLAVDETRSDERLKILKSGHACFLMRGHDVIEALNGLHLRRMGLTGDKVEYADIVVQLPYAVEPLVVVFQLQTDSRLVLTYRFETLIGVVNASIRYRPADSEPPFLATVGRADGIVVVNTEKAAANDLESLKSHIVAINPFVPIANLPTGGELPSEFERILFPSPAAWAVSTRYEGAVAITLMPNGLKVRRIECHANNPINDSRSNEPSNLGPVRAVHMRLAGHADIFKVSSMVARIAERAGEHLYRLRCTTAVPRAANPIEFRFVDGRFIHPTWSVPGETPETILTVVGRNFEVRDVMDDVAACGWDAEAIRRGEYSPF